MSRRDKLHYSARKALENAGWTITKDPLAFFFRNVTLKVDLGAEKSFAAEKPGYKIAVEVKNFTRDAAISNLEKTIGQLQLYQWAWDEHEPERELFLAVPQEAYNEFFIKPIFQLAVTRNKIKILVFDAKKEEISRWIRP